MKNSLGDLHNHLFEQLERLNDDDLMGEKLKEEISRAKAITGVAREIILNGKLVLDARVALQHFHAQAGVALDAIMRCDAADDFVDARHDLVAPALVDQMPGGLSAALSVINRDHRKSRLCRHVEKDDGR